MDDFCVLARAEPWPPPPVLLQVPPEDPELYTERTITMLVEGDTITAVPFRSMENQIDFRIEMDGNSYTLTKSPDVVIGSKAVEGEVPAHLNALFLVRDALMDETSSAQDITNSLAGAGSAAISTNGSVTMNITQKELLPSEGGDKMLLLRVCDWEKSRTINNYLSKIGWPNDDLSLFPFIVETALDICGWECGECADPICVFETIRSGGFLNSQQEIDELSEAFLVNSLDLTASELHEFATTFATVSNVLLLSSESSGDACGDFLSLTTLLSEMMNKPDYLEDLDQVSCTNDGTVLNSSNPMCPEFFQCTNSPDGAFETTGIRCLRAEFLIGGSLQQVFFGAIFFRVEKDENCPLCNNTAAAGLNFASVATQADITNDNLDETIGIRFTFLKYIFRGMRNFILPCVPADSGIFTLEPKLQNEESRLQTIQDYGTVYSIFNQANYAVCN